MLVADDGVADAEEIPVSRTLQPHDGSNVNKTRIKMDEISS